MSQVLVPPSTPGARSLPAIGQFPGLGGWHGPGDIQSVAGLDGIYLWTENPLQPMQITFRFDPESFFFNGTYSIRSGFMTIEQGGFYAVPDSPWSPYGGQAYIDVGHGGPQERHIIVSGMLTDSNWKILFMLLTPADTRKPAFSALRIA